MCVIMAGNPLNSMCECWKTDNGFWKDNSEKDSADESRWKDKSPVITDVCRGSKEWRTNDMY